jgi:hypothetical protein
VEAPLVNDLTYADASRNIPSRKQRGSAVPLVVVRHSRGPSLLKRQAWLCAVERLDLALFVDAEHNRSLRRIEVKPDNVGDFFLEPRVIRDLEALDEMRFQAGLRPDAPYARRADAYRLTAASLTSAAQSAPYATPRDVLLSRYPRIALPTSSGARRLSASTMDCHESCRGTGRR